MISSNRINIFIITQHKLNYSLKEKNQTNELINYIYQGLKQQPVVSEKEGEMSMNLQRIGFFIYLLFTLISNSPTIKTSDNNIFTNNLSDKLPLFMHKQ